MDALQRNDDGDTGVKELKIDSAVKFSHPAIADDLNIPSGANAIKWHYSLITNITPTIGGEVTQILGAYVGPMMVEGVATSNDELKKIKNWFEKYFEIAGTAYREDISFRNEESCVFSYPARGWSFYVAPTDFQGFKYDKSVYAVPWSVTMEIISDNALNYLSGVTMTSFTGPLANPAFVQVGYSDPTGTGKASMFVNPLLSGDIASLANTMGDNFQRLIATFATGNFQDFAYGYTKDFQLAGLPKNINAEYTKAYGSPYIVGGTQNTTTGGSGSGTITYGTVIQNPTTQAQVVQDIAIEFEAQGVPAQLGVAVAYNESGFDPNKAQIGCSGNGCGIGLFQMNNDGTGRGNGAKIRAGMAAKNSGGKFTDGYPALDQIKDAAKWFSDYAPNSHPDPTNIDQMAVWAQRAQAPPDGAYATLETGKASNTFKSDWNHAGTYLQAINFTPGGNYTNPFPGGWTPNRLDMGWDGTFKGQVVAPFDGQIIYAANSWSNWGGWIGIKAKSKPDGLPTSTLYFAEGIAPVVSTGQHVSAGDPIGKPAPSPYGNAYGTTSNGAGQIEWGVAQDGSVGSPVDTYSMKLGNGSTAARNMVLNFLSWAQNTLNVPGSPTSTSSAGRP